ncbi:hypothetical protein SAMN05216369_2461 [Marinobacter antarcticus]|uniref:DUF2202 domain-containing protein n=1 Tax=Marinobacter antarcticus TaxID=564117 RepID=A0A1M6TWI5_9GAMM|nr:DUF2202 domain-containing protein [Marinobacter antarcticus]SHK61405.1 hypothetical protein SAMN05216369_2461 [Marinobacter antarcticus]
MNIKKLMSTAIVTSIFMGGTAMAAGGPKLDGGGGGENLNQTQSTELTSIETSDLQFMREEEKLARDVYLTLDQQWGEQTQVFARIALSEESHTASVDYLLDKFGVEDPVVNDTIGVFTNQELQALYNELIEKGKTSFIDALYVGGIIEEKDMRDILAAISQTDERAIILAYSNLLDGSKSHLKAFVRVIEAQGLTYEAQVLDAEEVMLIIEDESEIQN